MPDSEIPTQRTGPNDPAELARLRILDAAANRAAEGLRVVEDFVRFALDDAHLMVELKAARHELTAALATVGPVDRLRARESVADVGAAITLGGEFDRPDVATVVAASFQRLQQALRSLEEYSKLSDPAAAKKLEALRYRVYTLERAVDITRQSMTRLADAKLYVLIDGGASESEFSDLANALVKADVPVLQLREKSLGDREWLARARLLRQLTRGSGTLFIMNDRPDLAALADADGVHVGQEELTVKDARAILGLRRLVGVSTHSLEQARQAVLDGADYIGVGPTFPGSTKQFSQFPGLELVRAVHAEIQLPAYPIGGITLDNLPDVLRAGATRVCVSAAIGSATDPGAATREFLLRLSHSND
jgi:thiamine-phosphate pyrophosphorylase